MVLTPSAGPSAGAAIELVTSPPITHKLHTNKGPLLSSPPLWTVEWTRVRAAIAALFPEMPISSEPEDFTVFSLKLDPAPAREKFKLCTIFLFTVGSGRSLAGAAEHGAPS